MRDDHFQSDQHPINSVSPGYLPLALFNLRTKVGKENTVCWLLVALAALISWSLGPMLASMVGVILEEIIPGMELDPTTSYGYSPSSLLYPGSMTVVYIFGVIGGLVFPVGVALWSQHIFKSTRNRTILDLTQGNMALMLADEQFGLIIDEAVQSKYRIVLGKVHLGGDLASKVNHFAYYYKYYYRMSFGPSELKVSTVSAESCWLEGCALIACNSCPFVLIAIALRIILVRPRILGIKTAVVEYLEGRHDFLLVHNN